MASEENPESVTVTTRPSRQFRRPSLTSVMTVWSLVPPGQVQQRTGMPSRVTARPMTICGRSLRWSLECPYWRRLLPSPWTHFSTGGAVRVRMVTGMLADFDAYIRHSGDAPDDPETRTRYATWRDAEAADETLLWPPARNGPCWCESGRKYKKCCGDPARN